MGPELHVLALAALLQAVQFVLYSITAQAQVGSKYALGPRDDERTLVGTAGRLKRAMNNHFEALTFFTIAVVVVVLGEKTSSVTAVCAHVYLIARILYVPAYASGATPWRSLIWFVGFGATVLMLIMGVMG